MSAPLRFDDGDDEAALDDEGPVTAEFMLLETGDYMLLETGDKMLLQ